MSKSFDRRESPSGEEEGGDESEDSTDKIFKKLKIPVQTDHESDPEELKAHSELSNALLLQNKGASSKHLGILKNSPTKVARGPSPEAVLYPPSDSKSSPPKKVAPKKPPIVKPKPYSDSPPKSLSVAHKQSI